MERQGRTRRAGGLLVVAAAMVCIGIRLLDRATDSAVAAPHTVQPDRYPFDADWPDVYLIVSSKCVGCHRAGTERTDFSSYESLLSARSPMDESVVVPGNPDASSFYSEVVWNHAALVDSDLPDEPRMPTEQAEWLTAGQIAIIERWINNGALEYRLPQDCSPRRLLEIDFPSAKECRVCHPRQYEQWSRSMHAYAAHSPMFEAFNLTLIERTSGTIGTFCSRCHMPLGTALGENGSRRSVHRSRLSMEGITCVACHRQARPYYKANARVAVQPGKLLETCIYGPFNDPASLEQRTHPAGGRAHLKSAAFCGACHDVTSPEGVRLEEAFSEWQNSPAARRGITCQHCHMGPVQGRPIFDHQRPLGRAAEVPGVDPELIPLRHLTDHTFAGPDYSLLPDTEFPHKLDWMYEIDYREYDRLTPYQQKTLNDLRRKNRRQLRTADEKRYELLKNAARIALFAPQTARPGERIMLRVNVQSLVEGHSFPTGFTAERQVWVELTVWDPQGRPVFRSGDLDANGDLRDAHSHEVKSGAISHDRFLLNFQNEFVALTNRGTERGVVLPVNRHLAPLSIVRPATGLSASFGRPPVFRLARGSLPPLGKASQRYPVRLPPCAGAYHVTARLNFRHLPPTLLDHIGTPHLKHLLEIVVIDERSAVIHVGDGTFVPPAGVSTHDATAPALTVPLSARVRPSLGPERYPLPVLVLPGDGAAAASPYRARRGAP